MWLVAILLNLEKLLRFEKFCHMEGCIRCCGNVALFQSLEVIGFVQHFISYVKTLLMLVTAKGLQYKVCP